MKSKTFEISIGESRKTFPKLPLFKKTKENIENYDFNGIMEFRQLLNHEKMRLLNVVKTQKPKSIYDLAKKLNRGFKSVNDDIKLLERFGVISLVEEKTKNRRRYKPEIAVDTLTIHLKI